LLIVVCPAYAKATWSNEMEVMGLGLPVYTLSGITRRRIDPPLGFSDRRSAGIPKVVLISWDVLGAWLPEILEFGVDAVVVLDESHEHATNPATQRYKAVRKLSLFAGRVWELSGTLYRKSALDLYWQARLVGAFRDYSAKAFGENFCVQRFNPFRGPFGSMEYRGLKPAAEHQLVSLIPNLSRVREGDLGYDVPAIRRLDRWVDVGTGYKGGDDAVNMEEARSRLVPTKIQRCLEFLDDVPQRPLVIYGWHQAFVETVAQKIPGAAFVTGRVGVVKRAEIQRDFAAGRIPVLVANLEAFGMSVSLAKSAHVIFGEVDWSATAHRQAEGRIRGPAQHSPHITYTYLLVKNSVDEFVWRVKLANGKAMDRLDKAVAQRIVGKGA
jgi:hypothetical protein